MKLLFDIAFMLFFIFILTVVFIKKIKSAELSLEISTLTFIIIAYILQKLSIINILNLKI